MRKSTLSLIAITAVIVVFALILRDADVDTSTRSTTTIVTELTTTTASLPRTTTTPLPPGVTVCDLYVDMTTTGNVESPALVEASGLAASRVAPGVLWSHNDSRGTATLYAFSPTGDDLGEYDVPGAFALDWEDMSAGPGPAGEGSYLYVGDIGDNFGIRGGLVTVYRVPDADPANLDGEFGESTSLTYRYPKGSPNAEALFIDPVEPALYLVTKVRDRAFVFKGSLSPSDGPSDLALVATLSLGHEITAADMSFDGTTLVLRGYHSVWMWLRSPGVSVAEMLSADPCTAPSPEELQGEAIALDLDLAYWTISEGSRSAIQVTERTG